MPKLNACHKWRENALFNTGNEGGGDEEACSEPLSSNALLERYTSSSTSGYKYREEWASVKGKAGIVLNYQLSLDCCGDLFVATTNLLQIYILVDTSICMYWVSSVCVCSFFPHNVCTVNVILHLLIVLMLFLVTITNRCGFEPLLGRTTRRWPLRRWLLQLWLIYDNFVNCLM
jgi:hypothetical protein